MLKHVLVNFAFHDTAKHGAQCVLSNLFFRIRVFIENKPLNWYK